MTLRKRIRMLTGSTFWDAGQRFMVSNEDDRYLYFDNADKKYCAIEKSLEGKDFIFLAMSDDQAYYQENRNEVLEQKRAYRKELKELVITRLGGRCRKCGYYNFGALDVKGGEARGQKGYTAFYNQVLRIVEMSTEHPYYLLCANCQRLEEE